MQLFLETYVNHTGPYSRSLWKCVMTCDFCHWHCHWRTKLTSFENAYLFSIMISSFYQRSTHSDIPVRNNNNRNNTVTPRYNTVVGRHLLRPPYKRGALWDPVDLFDIIIPRQSKGQGHRPSSPNPNGLKLNLNKPFISEHTWYSPHARVAKYI